MQTLHLHRYMESFVFYKYLKAKSLHGRTFDQKGHRIGGGGGSRRPVLGPGSVSNKPHDFGHTHLMIPHLFPHQWDRKLLSMAPCSTTISAFSDFEVFIWHRTYLQLNLILLRSGWSVSCIWIAKVFQQLGNFLVLYSKNNKYLLLVEKKWPPILCNASHQKVEAISLPLDSGLPL